MQPYHQNTPISFISILKITKVSKIVDEPVENFCQTSCFSLCVYLLRFAAKSQQSCMSFERTNKNRTRLLDTSGKKWQTCRIGVCTMTHSCLEGQIPGTKLKLNFGEHDWLNLVTITMMP